MKKFFCTIPVFSGTFSLTLLLAGGLTACSSTGAKKNEAAKAALVDIDDALLGTWVQTGISCSSGAMTPEGKEASAAFKTGMTVAKAVVTSDKVFWDMKEYRDVENPNDFCQVSVEEKWATPGPDSLVVSNSDTIVTGNGQVQCEKKYKYSTARTHKYKASEKELQIFLNSGHDAQTGVSSSEKMLCKEGQVLLSFQRDSADE